MALICALFEALWRRCFGNSGWDIPVLKIRAVQHIIGFLGLFCCLITKYSFWQAFIVAGIMQALYWARSHGAVYDYGHSEPDLKRYDQLICWKIFNKYIPVKQWCGFGCDYFLMMVRYTAPAILVGCLLLSLPAMFMGFCLSGMYALCWIGYDFGWTKRPTEIAEYLGGFVTGLLLML